MAAMKNVSKMFGSDSRGKRWSYEDSQKENS